MAIGGGTFTSQNRVLPGAYINFISASRADAALSDRGSAAMALELDWGPEGEVFTVYAEDFMKNARSIFGYGVSDDRMKGLCDLFMNIRVGHFYRLNGGAKASCSYATAKYSGVRGNDIKIVIRVNGDDGEKFDVVTVLDGVEADKQTVAAAADLQDNDYVVFKKEATLSATAGVALTGGSNAQSVQQSDYEGFLAKIESESFNTLGCLSNVDAIKELFVQFTKKMRDEVGVKFQTVLYRKAADYEGVISVENAVTDGDAASLGYWVTGLLAGCEVSKSCLNVVYDGAFTVDVDYTQAELSGNLKAGKFMLHKVGDQIRVLGDVNTFVSVNADKSADFSDNQVVRVLDQIGNDIAVLFNERYLGQVPNDAAGRISLWNDIVRHHQQLADVRAIEEFSSDSIVVSEGSTKKSVVVSDRITPVSAMAQLYMTVVVQ